MPSPKTKRKIYTAIVDDHELFRSAVSQLLKKYESSDLSFEITFEASDGKEFLEKVDEDFVGIDFIILDINMPNMNGIDTLKWIKKNTKCKVLMLTMYSDPSMVALCMKEGADGYLTKNSTTGTLLKAIECILINGLYYDEFTTQSVIKVLQEINYTYGQHQGKTMLATKILTEKEREVLKWFLTDYSYKEIAEKMSLSPRTIEGYRDDLFKKFETNNRVGVVVNAIKYGVIDLHEL